MQSLYKPASKWRFTLAVDWFGTLHWSQLLRKCNHVGVQNPEHRGSEAVIVPYFAPM
jgi:hypothetical protein